MIGYKAVDGAAQDGSDGEALGGSCLRELLAEVVGNAADEADGQVCSLILSDIAAEEVAEAADDHLAQFGHVKMLMDEGR